MNCRKCKTELPPDAQFCPLCGAKQEIDRSPKKRGNGQGTVYKRGESWYAEVCKYVEKKRIRTKKGGFARKKDALDYLPILRAGTTITKQKTVSFVALYDKVKETERYKNLSQSKKTAWRIAYNRCSALQTVTDYRDVRFEHMQGIVEGLTYYPARDVKVLLNAMSTLAMKYEWCEKNFAMLIELPPLAVNEKIVFSDEQLDKLWEKAEAIPFIDYILAMCYLGLRPIEMRSVKKENINLKERYLMGGEKTDYSKVTPIGIGEKILPVVKRLMLRSATDKLLDMSLDDFYDSFYDALDKAGIQKKDTHTITPVCCRHTYVTRLTKTGAAPAVLQKAARHTKYQTTLGYTHMDIKDVLEAVDKL